MIRNCYKVKPIGVSFIKYKNKLFFNYIKSIKYDSESKTDPKTIKESVLMTFKTLKSLILNFPPVFLCLKTK